MVFGFSEREKLLAIGKNRAWALIYFPNTSKTHSIFQYGFLFFNPSPNITFDFFFYRNSFRFSVFVPGFGQMGGGEVETYNFTFYDDHVITARKPFDPRLDRRWKNMQFNNWSQIQTPTTASSARTANEVRPRNQTHRYIKKMKIYKKIAVVASCAPGYSEHVPIGQEILLFYDLIHASYKKLHDINHQIWRGKHLYASHDCIGKCSCVFCLIENNIISDVHSSNNSLICLNATSFHFC